MRAPRRDGFERYRTILRLRRTPYTLDRPDGSHGGRFGSNDSSTTSVSGVELWVFSPQETNINTQYGDRMSGSMRAFALPSADVQVNDRLTHGGHRYEVDDYNHLPNDDEKKLMLIDLTRVEN